MKTSAPPIDVVVIDRLHAIDALVKAKQLQASGTRFLARVETGLIRSGFAADLFERVSDPDERLALVDAMGRERLIVDGKPQSEVVKIDPAFVQAAREVLAIADGVIVRGWSELYYFETLLRVTVEPVFVDPSIDKAIPDFTRADDPDAVVVWAPVVPARELAVVALALEELHRPVFIISAEGELPNLGATFLPYERSAEILPRAAVVVAVGEPRHQPGNALAFARLGVPVAASWWSGAAEALDGISLFIPWDRGDVLRAVQRALGNPPAMLRRPLSTAEPRRTLLATAKTVVAVFAEAVRLREAGETFDLALHVPDLRTIAEPIEEPALYAMRDLIGLAERIVVRSWLELARIASQFGQPVLRSVLVPSFDDTVPAVQREPPDGSIVIWAPRMARSELSVILSALEEPERSVVVVCSDGPLSPAEAGPSLARACVIVDADCDDPGPARALARVQAPLCVTTASGAREFLRRVHPYRPWHKKSVSDAVHSAFNSPPPEPRT